MKNLFLAAVATIVSMSAFAQQTPAQTTYAKKHPRVHEVNKRVRNQEKRITEERKEGDLTAAQAAHDRRDLKRVKAEERNMNKHHRGHLTKAEQARLNRQLNNNSKKIGE